jgi:dTDP-4-amino-4,6-dideoxygalactose transaminase
MNTFPGYQIPFTGIQRQYNNLREEILDATDQVLRSGNLMSGEQTTLFEEWLAKKNCQRFAITCHSGTQALEIIASYYAEEVSIQPPRVILPALTFPATANAWSRAGWEIDLIDTDAYGQIDYSKIDRSRSRQAICVVGLYGQSLKDDTAYYYSDIVIEDGAQHWISDNYKRQGLATAISFDPTKNFANYGNGGAIVTDDSQLADFARDWTTHGKQTKHTRAGSNSRMSEVDCAQMMIKTRCIKYWQQRRREIAQNWMNRLENSPVRSLIDATNFDTHCYHKFVIEVDGRDELAAKLKERGVETKVHYTEPLWNLPAYSNCYHSERFFSGAEALAKRCLSLPIYPELSDNEVAYVIDQVLDCVS